MKVGTDGVLLGAWADTAGAKSILDIGTGTGVIAIMLAQRAPEATVCGVEIEEDSYLQAAENMANSPFAQRMEAQKKSIQDFAKLSRDSFDLIVSNPPFFTGGTLSINQDKLSVRHTVKLSHGDLLQAVRKLLSKNGKFCAILPNIEGMRFREIAKTYNLHCTKQTSVFPIKDRPVERLLLQFELESKPVVEDELTILKSGNANDWTDEYTVMAKDFYVKM